MHEVSLDCAVQWEHVPEAQCIGKKPRELGTVGEVITCLTSHPESDILLLGTASGKIVVWDPEQGVRTHVFQAHGKDVTRIVFTGNGRKFLTTSVDGFVHWWDHQFHRLQGYSTGSSLYCAAISPRGRELATGGQDRKLRIWDVETGNLIHTLEGHQDAVSACVWTTDKVLVSAGADGSIRAWEVDARRCYKSHRGHLEHIAQLQRSQIGNWYVSASWDHTIKVWNFQHREKFAFPAGTNSITGIAFTADETLLAAAYWDGTVRVWNVESGKLHDEFQAHEDSLMACAFMPGSQSLVTIDQQGSLRSWNLDELGTSQYLNQHSGEVYCVKYTPDNLHLISVGHDGRLKVWDRNTCSEIRSTETHLGPITACAVAPDNRQWALGTSGGAIKLWDVEQDRVDASLPAHREAITALQFFPLQNRILSCSWDMKVKLWFLETQAIDCVGDGHNAEVAGCEISPDGRTIVSAAWDSTARIWGLHQRNRRDLAAELKILEGHDGRVTCCTFTPDGTRVATGSMDQTIRLWPMDKSGEPRVLLGHSAALTALRFTPDGRLLLSSDRDGNILVWDGEHCRPLGHIQHDNPILTLAIAPDGLQAAIGDEAGRVRFLSLQYHQGPLWITASSHLKAPPLWKRGSPMVEFFDAICIYCGRSDSIKQKQLGELWRCPSCNAEMMISSRALPAIDV